MNLEDAIKNREDCLKYLEGIGQMASHDSLEAVRWSIKALKALRPVSRERVEKVWKGDWLRDFDTGEPICGNCHHVAFPKDYVNGELPHFCEFCGKAKTGEAVQMVMERMEALKDGSTTD